MALITTVSRDFGGLGYGDPMPNTATDAPLRVLFDAFWWVEGPTSNRLVQRRIIRTWAQMYPQDELILAVPSAHRTQLGEVPAGASVVTTPLRPHGIAVAVDLPRLARRVDADITITHNFAPHRGRSAVFVHDVLFQTDPEWFTAAERAYLSPIPSLLRRAGVVLTSSATEAARIRRCNRALRTVTPVGLAVDPELLEVAPEPPTGLGDLDGFVLSVGRLNVRKNLEFTIRAAVRSGRLTPRFPLLVVGEAEGRAASFQDVDVQRALGDGRVRLLGGVSLAELAWLYRTADLFVFLSLDEGFGLPPIEARAFGTPVLAADIPVMRENLTGWADFVDPRDERAAAAAIASSLESGARMDTQAAPPRWEDTVSRMRDAVLPAARRRASSG